MLIAIVGILIFGALFAIPRWLQVVGHEPVAPFEVRRFDQPARPRGPAATVRGKRQVHSRRTSGGKSSHHAGL